MKFMSLSMRLAMVAAAFSLSACSTSQSVTLGRLDAQPRIERVTHVADEGNATDMDDHLTAALMKQGISVTGRKPQGTQKDPEADALVSYVPVWRWDVVMYLKSLTVKIREAKSGTLLAMGQWDDSALHGYRDPATVMEGLIGEMLAKMGRIPAQGETAQSTPRE